MDFLFPKPKVQVIKTKPRSALGEYFSEHHSEFVVVSFLLGAYATIKVLLLQHDMNRMMTDADYRSHQRACYPDDER